MRLEKVCDRCRKTTQSFTKMHDFDNGGSYFCMECTYDIRKGKY